ncbi:ribosylnicotinamide kinase [Aspergillus clavatus NRRL 1]|uniref:Nicotinamide riboside kinase n=1 Tax=Aspergillus clavatus (strain ATCC 1007 / CBS 513.65 / DSM 816 / NCTC 3887 / NRRL 1 / QM 1276 / 107) TaxID=344612 RepID=A1CI24_ASPCL|nr:uncharacterized protein ACLA_050010 [Aspergillus clavatus NRRL 1]EAW10529.1 conserved hypothetical protein [Aspergillus clavatus NRRL 1]
MSQVTIVGISGPSSSGKTTLARLLQSIFSHVDPDLHTFIIHEDDFYLPDDKIPYTTTASGTTVQDWDTVEALDVPFMAAALAYVRAHGHLPPRLKSKEDLNEASDSGVREETVLGLRRDVSARLQRGQDQGQGKGKRTLVFFEGFLLFSPPGAEVKEHVLRPVHEQIDVHLFLPAPYDLVKGRRESRSGYVTIGPAPIPATLPQRGSPIPEDVKQHVDLEKEDDAPPQNFWTDPPGYVDDIVWPRYVRDHAWLLLPETPSPADDLQELKSLDTEDLIKSVGQGVNLRDDAGVIVAPGKGASPMADVLKWAVEEVIKPFETVG